MADEQDRDEQPHGPAAGAGGDPHLQRAGEPRARSWPGCTTALPAVHALVVDDGSPDGTGELADEMAAGDDRVHVLHRTEKAGLGAAYIAGFGWALDRDYAVIVEMDADGSHAPEDLPRLLDALTDADLVLGSRYVPGGRMVNWPK